MAAPLVTLRCTRCGGLLSASVATGGPTTFVLCPHCANPVAAVPLRDPPPLFTWEVFPHLYPPLPPPRALGRRARAVATAFLLAATVAIVGVAGAFGVAGAISLGPSAFTVEGVVDTPLSPSGALPVAGAVVTLHGENHFVEQLVTAQDGSFRFTGVPGGGVLLNVTAPGFDSASVTLFVSPLYTASGRGPGNVEITVPEGNGSFTVYTSDSPFADLESFVASLWSATILLALAATVTGFGALYSYRGERASVAVAGSVSASAAPAVFYLLALDSAFPWTLAAAAGIFGSGVVALFLSVVPMAATAPAPDPD
ncbi:MAG: carboxypeptidase-like regulatory domain-containing protein [Thermoplasmata archaeon]|nr:carboxypeptidase-like regulatory domain-containing protein [Thermoplasmata archaeon]